MARGRHRKPREIHPERVIAAGASIALVGVAAVTVGMTNDPRYLRIATVAALVGALLPSVVLRPHAAARRAQEAELAELRLEVSRLRLDVAMLHAVPRPRTPERVTTTLSLPLVRAALTPSGNGWANVNGNGNGHHRVLDLTDPVTSATV